MIMNDMYERIPANEEEAYRQIEEILNAKVQENNRRVILMFICLGIGLAIEAAALLILRGNTELLGKLGLPVIIFNAGVLVWASRPFGRCLKKKMIYENAGQMIKDRTIENPIAFVEQLKEDRRRGRD